MVAAEVTPDCSEILVVEDEHELQVSLSTVLGDEGYSVTCVNHGKAALEHLRSPAARPCVILLDLMMPVMTGFDFRREQQRDPSLAAIPVIVLSANAGDHAGDVQPAATFRKPVELDEVIGMVRLLLAESDVWHS